MRRRLLFLSLLLVPLATRAQQVGVLTHDAVLHDGPSRTAPRLGDLAAGETVSLLRREHRNGYLQVRTQTEDVGWVWELYVHLVDPTEVHEPTTPHTLVPSPLGVDVPAGDFDNCPDSGDAQLARVRVLNRLKNRSAEPRDADIDSSVTLAAMLAPSSGDSGDLGRFQETKAAEITAFVYRVIPGGKKETANCKLGDPVHRDTHIELILGPSDTAEIRRVIAEVTPRWRAALKDRGVDWSTAALQQTIEGHWVRLRGWLMFDLEHQAQAENTNPGNSANWRATAWEIHPITFLAAAVSPP